MNDKYILKGKKPVKTEDVVKWGRWFETGNRIVKQQTLKNGKWVSTVFLGLDHNFTGGKPLLFETMVFTVKEMERKIFGKKKKMVGDELDVNRYSTWREAEKGHKKMVRRWAQIK